MRQTNDLPDAVAHDVLSSLLSVDHGWWCDVIEDYTDARDRPRQRLANRPYYSQSFLKMYGYSREEMSLAAILGTDVQPDVIREIKEAIRPGAKGRSGTMVAWTKAKEKKLVEVYLRRVDRPDGTALLASLHSDLTISSDVQWIERNVLLRLQAFVFVKRWDPARRLFIFTYMNERLANVLRKTPAPTAADGLSDDDFFDDYAQKRAFEEADKEVRDTDDPNLVIIREETFDPRPPAAGSASGGPAPDPTPAGLVIPKRLLTFKTPFWPPSRGTREGGWEVLGIAIDVTNVTDVLRSIADNSDSGLYIKDAERRYQYVNKKFLELLQAPGERQVLDRTFAEALRELREIGGGPLTNDIERLDPLIQAEDQQVFAGKPSVTVRELELPKATDWLTQKQPIHSQDGRITHLLGMTSPLFPGRLGSILDKLPQCISVKKYYPAERDQPGEFKLVWANRSYLDIHGEKSLSDVIGSTDTDMWPDDPEQVAQFRRHDRLVVDSYQKLRADPEWSGLSPGARWGRIVTDLQACGCWEFRETTRSKTQTRVLQTTKWAEAIDGSDTLFVVVVYSDVTQGDAEQRRYHEMTVHNLRGATGPVGIARMHLRGVLENGEDSGAGVRAAIACLDDTSHAVDLFLLHHLNLLKMNVVCRATGLDELVARLRPEAERLQRNWGVPVKVGDGWAGAVVSCDPTLLRFVLNELLLNAVKAARRRGEASAAEQKPYEPFVSVRFEQSPGEVRCVLEDNGVACSDPEERAGLIRSFAAAKDNPFNRSGRSFGLSFCVVAVRAQGGRLELVTPTDDHTEVEVYLPLIPSGAAS